MAAGAAFYYRPQVQFDADAVAKYLTRDQQPVFDRLLTELEKCANWDHAGIETAFGRVMAATGLKLGKIGPVVRVALVGGTTSPSIYQVLEVLGRQESLRRLRSALTLLS
jgi:glutamyl-tRNA synthetase